MHLRFVFLLICVFVAFFGQAGKIDKAFECLKQMNYFEAKMLFEKELAEYSAPSAFGLATIFYRNDNPFHHIDSAYKYISIAEKNFKLMTSKDQLRFLEFGVTYENIISIRSKVVSEFFQSTLKVNTEEAYDKFCIDFPWSKEDSIASFKRDSIIVLKAFNVNKSYYYDSIIKRYPHIQSISKLQDRYELTYFAEMTNGGTTNDYVRFINENPQSKYIEEAQNNVFDLETKENSIECLTKYIQKYSNYQNINSAWRKLYSLYMVEYSEDRVKKFKKEFPDYPFKDELKRDIELVKLELFPFKRGNLYGLMNHKGIEIYSPDYESINLFSEGLSLAVKGGLYGYIDKLNNVVIPFQFEFGSDFSNGRAIVEIGGKSGVINRAGKYILPLEFNELGQYSEGLIYGVKDSLFAFYDLMGNKVTEERFSDVFPFEKGISKVVVNGKQAFIDFSGSYVSEPMHKELYFYNDSFLVFQDSILFGIKTILNRVVVKPMYEYISPLVNGRAIFVLNNKLGYLDESGKKIIKNTFEVIPNYQKVCLFNDGYAKVRYKSRYGVIDKNGKYWIMPEYFGLGDISKLVSFSKGKQWGYLKVEDKSMVITPIFDYASSFHFGLAVVEVKNLQGVINEKAKWIIPAIFTNIKLIADNYFLVFNGDQYGLYALSGDQLIPLEYKQIRLLTKDLLVLTNDDQLHYYYLPDHKLIKPSKENE
jgi:hypothetical protein